MGTRAKGVHGEAGRRLTAVRTANTLKISAAGEMRMDQDLDSMFGFAPDHDQPIPYMQRTRDYYKAIGYTTPYRWALFLRAPFTPLKKPLSQCNVAIVTTAAPYQPDKG